jgi:hydroxymethylpyrimidine/phosphomethylpyrimidine kinase
MTKPNVMCFSGLDPSGGAGIQADIEALFSGGCHCTPIITTLTVQDSGNVVSMVPVNASLVVEQARAVLEDMPIHAFKIGLLGSVSMIEVIHTILTDYPQIPVVVDPILRAGGGYELSSKEIIDAMISLLLPLTTVLTPNTNEIRQLAPTADTLEACAAQLLDTGCENILLTGGHMKGDRVENRLFRRHQPIKITTWPRLGEEYHGSGCTLAASLSAYLAHGLSLQEAVQQAQKFTWDALSFAERPGCGQHFPNRSYWNRRA